MNTQVLVLTSMIGVFAFGTVQARTTRGQARGIAIEALRNRLYRPAHGVHIETGADTIRVTIDTRRGRTMRLFNHLKVDGEVRVAPKPQTVLVEHKNLTVVDYSNPSVSKWIARTERQGTKITTVRSGSYPVNTLAGERTEYDPDSGLARIFPRGSDEYTVRLSSGLKPGLELYDHLQLRGRRRLVSGEIVSAELAGDK